jgi:lambda family phage minor tail protein L
VSVAPATHLTEALKLQTDAIVALFEVQLKGVSTIVRFRDGPTVTWQGQVYESMGCALTGEGSNADGEHTRPILSVNNPENIFGAFCSAGYFDLATAIRREVLQADLLANANIFQQRVWIIGRPSSVKNPLAQFELRSPIDMPGFMIPNRYYMPPEFPFIVTS